MGSGDALGAALVLTGMWLVSILSRAAWPRSRLVVGPLAGRPRRRPVPIRTARLTRAGPQPCAAARASGAGLEPATAGVRALLGSPTPHPEPVRAERFELSYGRV